MKKKRVAIPMILTGILLGLPLVAATSGGWDDDPKGIKGFILAGQSNMVGYGKVEQGGNPAWEKGNKDIPKEIKGGVRCLREMAANNANIPNLTTPRCLPIPASPRPASGKPVAMSNSGGAMAADPRVAAHQDDRDWCPIPKLTDMSR